MYIYMYIYMCIYIDIHMYNITTLLRRGGVPKLQATI